MASSVYSFAIHGVDGYLVEVEVDTIFGIPSVSIVGLGDKAVKEARERLESAITHAGFTFPEGKVVINLAPSDLKKSGTHFDLAIAVGLLLRTNQMSCFIGDVHTFGLIGEVSLNASLRPCSGVLPMAMEAKKAGLKSLLVAADNVQEARLVEGIDVYGFHTLAEVVQFLQEKKLPKIEVKEEELPENSKHSLVDFSDVKGQSMLIDYIAIAASGSHNLLMIGPPGCGKSMIAKRIPTILPKMSSEEALEVTKIYSVASLLKQKGQLVENRPFRAPHHNASTNALIGGGNTARPGEIPLAHHGILFLDEIAEFHKKTLDALRQPMEDREVTITRVNGTNTYPANFMLVAAMNPCPCGYFGQEKCRCTDYEIVKYQQKLSGPILDRMDIQKHVHVVNFFEEETSSITSSELQERVTKARLLQEERYRDIPAVYSNAQLTPALIKEFCPLDSESENLLQKAYERFHYSGRTIHKFIKVARTIADLDEAVAIHKQHIMKSLMARDLDKDTFHLLTM